MRKFLFLAEQAKAVQKDFLNEIPKESLVKAYFDEMETFEHSKCKPLSIPLVVTPERKIIGFRVCSRPAKGRLAAIAKKKYGPRKNDRPKAAHSLFAELMPWFISTPTIVSDEEPNYPSWLRPYFTNLNHETYKSRKACVVGQGELKAGGFDPLFAFNHTAAMIRANVNRLFRRTWNTTKLKERLDAHLWIYADYHNRILT